MSHTVTDNEIVLDLEKHARQIRRDIVTMIHLAEDGHPGPALSVTDILTALYFHFMKIEPLSPDKADRDRLILSKGHACPALYATLARRGYFSPDELPGLRSITSHLQGHPDMNKTPGVDSTSGSLGNGIGIGLGMALANRYKNNDFFTYVVTGDGELQEGVVWEAVMAAAHFRADHLVVLIDNNEMQSGGTVQEVSGLYPILPKFESFGWDCQEIDGHDYSQLLHSIDRARKTTNSPSVILCHTKKGHGIALMEGDNSWHKRVPTKAELVLAIEQIGKE